MKNVLVLGSGMVSRPLVRYLLDHKLSVTAADKRPQAAEKVINNHPNGTAAQLDIADKAALASLVGKADVVVSILPFSFHPEVAKVCLDQGTHLVTSSYVSDEMRAFDGQAQTKGLIFLNELGLDPGIDHMTAMEVIHREQGNGKQVVSFSSHCGGLPAPEANDNPFGYKFSWTPRGVFVAMRNSATFLQGGQRVTIPNANLFSQPSKHQIDGIGALEGYPNRDSLGYIQKYGLAGIQNMLRGTLRNVGWSNFWHQVCRTNLLDDQPMNPVPANTAEFTARLIGASSTNGLDTKFAKALGLKINDRIIKMARWLGLFSAEQLPLDAQAPIDIIAGLAAARMAYAPGERDMAVMQHRFEVLTPNGTTENITSTMVVFGTPNGDSSMATTVGTSAAIGARFIAEGIITARGVQIPIIPEIYQPILAELDSMGIKMKEEIEVVG